MKIVDIANEIYEEAGNPTSTSIPAIAFWIRAKVGTINNLLFEDFAITDDTKEIIDPSGNEITPEAVAVIKQIYRIYDYQLQLQQNLNAISGGETLLQVVDNGSSITRLNRNELAKTLAAIRKTEMEALNTLVNAYRSRGSTPQGIIGDDTVPGHYPSSSATYRRD
jgi:hypothetical protein